jgi:hypothetical protein
MKIFNKLGLAALMLCAVSACDTVRDAPAALTDQEYDEVAQTMGSVVAGSGGGGDVGTINNASRVSVGIMPIGANIDVSGSVNGNDGGVSYSFALTCADSAGVVLSACGSTTDRADIEFDLEGDIAFPPNFSASVLGSGDWSLTDVQTGVGTLNGTTAFTIDSHFMTNDSSTVRDYHLNYDAAFHEILVDFTAHAIVGGRAHYDVDLNRHEVSPGVNQMSTFAVDAVVTFNADGTATLVLDGNRTYVINTATGTVTLHGQV